MRSTLRFLLVLLVTLLPATYAHASKTILVFGDSLSAGYGIRQDAAWPALLQQRLGDKRLDYSVVNASISGETSSGGLTRIKGTLTRQKPAIVIIALGANDGLRGLPLDNTRSNLSAMIRAARAAKAKVLVVGMRLPPNYGSYAEEFQKSFAEVARQENVPLVPFLLEGIADQPQLFQADTIHPTAEAQPALLNNVWNGLAPLLK